MRRPYSSPDAHQHLTQCSLSAEDSRSSTTDASAWRTSMEMLTPASTCRHARIRLTTRHPTEFIDLTDRLERLVADAGVRVGILNIQTLHTTTAVIVNEHE